MNRILAGILFWLVLSGCQPQVEETQIPNVLVNIEINLNELDNAPLQQIGGYIYVLGGVRGIILRRESQSVYRAFEQNCPYQPLNTCAKVDMHSSEFYFEDVCCSSTFDLTGFPTGGPVQFPLKQYSISISGDYLFIYN